MKRLRRVLAVAAYVAAVGLCGVLFTSNRATATAIDNDYLDSMAHVQDYLRSNYPGYLTYTKGTQILYRVNGTGAWANATDGIYVSYANRPDDYNDEKDACVNIELDTFKFKSTFRSNIARTGPNCGTTSDDMDDWTYEGGRIKINPPDGVPVALWVTDIDSKYNNWQRIWFAPTSAIVEVFTPEDGPKFNYDASDGKLSNNAAGNGLCGANTNPKCNAIVLLSANEFYAKVSLKSSQGLMVLNNDLTQEYRTLTFDPNGGCVTDNDGDAGKIIRSYTSSCAVIRDYVHKDTALAFPTPVRAGYKFDYWYTDTGTVVSSQIMSDDVSLHAHWTHLPYTLTPSVSLLSPTVSMNESAGFTYSVAHSGATSADTAWKIRSVVIAPGATLPTDYLSGFDGTGRTCASYYTRPGIVSCNDTAVEFGSSGTGVFPGTTIAGQTIPQSYPMGTRICRSLTVDSYNEYPQPNARTSALSCVLVVRAPLLQVWGNDVRVGSTFAGGGINKLSVVNTNRGSWGEYGVIVPGLVTSFGSNASLGGTSLTFANRKSDGTPILGGFTQASGVAGLGTIPDVAGYMAKVVSLEYRDRTGVTEVTDVAKTANIDAYAHNKVYTSTATVRITDDIINPSKGADLGQMVIIAPNILIDPSVAQVDAWLIATNTVNTCNVAGNPSADNCGTVLKINGPIMANHLLLNRTGGDDADLNSPAEIVNLRGDAYIWVRRLSSLTGTVRTVYTRELAPRY